MLICANCGTENPVGSRFCNGCGAVLEIGAPVAETRKTVTILFIDATSSTALGERLDPESMRGLMTRYFDVMREVIEFHGGSVEKFIGDAVMAVFGVPAVHEDDALRACRSAVAIKDRLTGLEPQIRAEQGVTVEWRMGINTGEVVAGDGVTGQRMVTGDAVNVAARLEAAASPGEILLGAETHSLVRSAVTAEAIEPLPVKGKADPVPAWRLTGVEEMAGRHGRAREGPMVGRRRPLRLLDDAFKDAVEERVCHLFTVLGLAGVGKSRLVGEFLTNLGDEARVASGRCLAYGVGITYWPVVEAVRHGAGIAESDPAEVAAARLRLLLTDEPEADRVASVMGNLLGIVEASPQPDEVFWAIRRTFEAMARQRPLVLVFDDIHWGEATFLDLIDHIADWTRDAPILLLAMARPELLEKRPAWGGGKRSATTMQLEPLSEEESNELVAGILGRAELPDEIRTQISRAAEGNPLFVEELLGKLIDDGFLVESADGWAAFGDAGQLSIPPTIQALLAARLDGLGAEERAVIERGAIEGKVFHRGAVTALAPELMRPAVRERLSSLLRMELLRPEQASFAGEEAYEFRHLLIRDAAYQALAKQTRSELHERFAGWLELVTADRAAEYAEVIAYHLEQAFRYRAELGPPDAVAASVGNRAGSLLGVAARRAAARGDARAAADLVDRAIDLLPSGAERRLLIAQLADNAFAAGAGPAEALLEETLADARAAADIRAALWAELKLRDLRSSTMSTEAADDGPAFDALRDRFLEIGDAEGAELAELKSAFMTFAMGRAGEAYRRATAIIEAGPSSDAMRYEAVRTRGGFSVWGPLPIDEAISVIESQRLEVKVNGGGPEVAVARLQAWAGRFPAAEERLAAGRIRAEEFGDRMLLSTFDETAGEIAVLTGDYAAAITSLQRSYDTKVALGDRAFASTTAGHLANAYLLSGNLDAAWEYATIARDTSAADDIASQSSGRAIQARVLAEQAQYHDAERLAREAVAIMAATDYHGWHGEAARHLAHVLHAAGKDDEARGALTAAVRLYEAKGATFLAERATTLLAEWSAD